MFLLCYYYSVKSVKGKNANADTQKLKRVQGACAPVWTEIYWSCLQQADNHD
jgi:hypothetical protein